MYCADMASGKVRFSESRMKAHKSAIHRLAHATQSSLDGNAAVAHIRVAQATQDPLRLLCAAMALLRLLSMRSPPCSGQLPMRWNASSAKQRKKQKKPEKERKRARSTEENKRKRAEHQAGVEQRKQARVVKKAARDAEKEGKRLAREVAGLPARGARRKADDNARCIRRRGLRRQRRCRAGGEHIATASATTTTQQLLHCRGAVCRRAR